MSTSRVKTKRLDDIPECADTGIFKIDVLKHAVVVGAEAGLVRRHKDEPLFGNFDVVLRSRGLLRHSIPGVAGRVFKPPLLNNGVNAKLNQTHWTNAVWVMDFTRFRALSAEHIPKPAVVINDECGSLDLAAFALQYDDEKKGTHMLEKIVKRLFGGVAPPRGPMPQGERAPHLGSNSASRTLPREHRGRPSHSARPQAIPDLHDIPPPPAYHRPARAHSSVG